MHTFGVSQATGQRSVPRTDSSLMAVISMSAGDYPAFLIDISRTGVRLRGENLPRVGQQVSFRADTVHACGGVVWSGTGTCAIEFDTPISISEVQRLRSQGLGRCSI